MRGQVLPDPAPPRKVVSNLATPWLGEKEWCVSRYWNSGRFFPFTTSSP
jgi:hypothetical protein